jgi:hypothetical protein
MVAEGDEPPVEVVAAVAKSPVAMVAEDEPPVEIATGAAQLPVAAAAMPFAASPFAESKDIHLSCKKNSKNWQKITRETVMQKTIIMRFRTIS